MIPSAKTDSVSETQRVLQKVAADTADREVRRTRLAHETGYGFLLPGLF